MDVRRLITLARAWLPLVLVSAVLAAVVGYVVSGFQQRVYEARATLIVGQALSAANPDYSQLVVAQNLSTTYAAVAETRPLLEKVIARLGLDATPGTLGAQVQVSAPRESTLLFITAQDTDAARAADVANALAAELIAASPSIQGEEAAFRESVDQDITATRQAIEQAQLQVDELLANGSRTSQQDSDLARLEDRLASLRATYATLLNFASDNVTNLLTIVEPAATPSAPIAPRSLLNALLAALLAVAVVAFVAFVSEQLDDRLRSPNAVYEATGLSTLGTIAKMNSGPGRQEFYQLAAMLFPRSNHAEAYRTLRTNVDFASVDEPIGTLLVTSAGTAEGKTVTAGNLAVVFAQAGRNVLLVDADLRKPSVHVMFGLPNTHGLTTLLLKEAVPVDTVAFETEQDNLRILTSGPIPGNPAELLGSQRMQAILQRLNKNADLVIFDSPPLLGVTDAAVISAFAGGTLLVIDAAGGHAREVRSGLEALHRAGANILGVVLNRVSATKPFGYGDFYGEVPTVSGQLVADGLAERRAPPT